jgi:hypothetical protein
MSENTNQRKRWLPKGRRRIRVLRPCRAVWAAWVGWITKLWHRGISDKALKWISPHLGKDRMKRRALGHGVREPTPVQPQAERMRVPR